MDKRECIKGFLEYVRSRQDYSFRLKEAANHPSNDFWRGLTPDEEGRLIRDYVLDESTVSINVSMAKLRGWIDIGLASNNTLWGRRPDGVRWAIPEYATNLNDVAEFEKFIGTEYPLFWSEYLDNELPEICNDTQSPPECASALTRCKAIKLTLIKIGVEWPE
jgi:hypothetical protein